VYLGDARKPRNANSANAEAAGGVAAILMNLRAALVSLSLMLVASVSMAGEVVVSAAASLSDALRDVAAKYEKRTGDHVVLNFGASGALALQVKAGAPVDVFFSANGETIDLLAGLQLVDNSSRRAILTNTLAIVVPAGSALTVTGPRDLLNPAIRRLAIGQPDSVPAGIYARQYLQKAGIWSLLAARMVPTEDVRAALAAVAAGNADAAIVYRTDALSSTKVRIALSVPAAEGPKIVYPAVVIKHARNPKGARRFIDYLGSREARSVFAKYGFGTP
jgi:molybdate transport system substrate-binding protein